MQAIHLHTTDLRLLREIADAQNITEAAGRLHLSLSAASGRIKSMEEQLGTVLLDRLPRGVRLTQAGEAVVFHARQMLQQLDAMKSDLTELAQGLRGHVRIHANTTAVTDFLPNMLSAFLSQNPDVSIDLQEHENGDIVRAVLERRTDIGIVSAMLQVPGLDTLHFSTDRLVLITPLKHALAKRKTLSFAEALDNNFVGMRSSSSIQTFLSQVVRAMGKELRLRIQLGSFPAICNMVAGNVGVAVVPESVARRLIEQAPSTPPFHIVALTDPWAVRERSIVVRSDEGLPEHTQALVDMIRNYEQSPCN
jgi:DNA-binding transcriptional LysR family regulator